jgi:DNA-binding response OmpR family regulator
MAKKKILIVEDDQMIASMYKTKFEADGFECLMAGEGPSGLEMVKTEKPDLVMLDIMLPQLDGFSILKAIKNDNETKNTPVIMLTNLGTEEDKAKGQKMGAIDYLVKASLTPAEISKKIKDYLK